VKPLDPVDAVPLFPKERAALLELLSSLDDGAWSRETSCPGWSLKDIAAHLLADDLGRLSGSRDGHAAQRFEPSDAATFEPDLLAFINAQNEAWVAASRRLSPRVITDLLRWSGEQTQAYFESLDPDAPAAIGVSWAGETQSANWFDLAREYTERWHHQAQIREAAGAPMLYEPELFAPLIDTFIRALPHTFRDTDADEGAHVEVLVSVPAVGAQSPAPLRYSLVREAGRWGLYQPVDVRASATVTMDGDVAWRLFTKGIPKAEAIARSALEGDQLLAERVFDTVSIIA
jgi:uncharacterized protein (TIGR03083 family)